MKPVMQTAFGPGKGNCRSAAIASILEIDIDEVPYFNAAPQWYLAQERWLASRGLAVVAIHFNDEDDALDCLDRMDGGHWIGSGPSPRGLSHSVVYCGGRLAHDPHPDGGGLARLTRAEFFVPCPTPDEWLAGTAVMLSPREGGPTKAKAAQESPIEAVPSHSPERSEETKA